MQVIEFPNSTLNFNGEEQTVHYALVHNKRIFYPEAMEGMRGTPNELISRIRGLGIKTKEMVTVQPYCGKCECSVPLDFHEGTFTCVYCDSTYTIWDLLKRGQNEN